MSILCRTKLSLLLFPIAMLHAASALDFEDPRCPKERSQGLFSPWAHQLLLPADYEGNLEYSSELSIKLPDNTQIARKRADITLDRTSVLSYGAKCDGKADDTAGFAKAAATGRQIFIPPFVTCQISKISLPSTGGSFIGAGRGGKSVIKLITPPESDAITIVGPGGFLARPGNWTTLFRDLTIDASENTTMTGRAIRCQGAAGVVLERVQFKGVPNVAYVKDCVAFTVLDTHVEDLKAADGVGFELDGGSFFGDRLYYSSTKPGGFFLEPEAFFKVRHTFGVYLGLGVISHVRRGLYVVPAANQFAEYSTIGGIQFDQCSLACIEMLADGGTIRGWQFNGTWASTAGTNIYLHTNSGQISDIELNGVRAVNAMNSNLIANDVTGLKIVSGDYSSAGYRYSGTCDTASDGTFTVKKGFEINTVFAGHVIAINGASYTVGNLSSNVKAQTSPTPPNQTGVPCSFTSPAAINMSLGGATKGVQIVGSKVGRSSASRASPSIGLSIGSNVDKVFTSETDFSGVAYPVAWNRIDPMSEADFTGNQGLDTIDTSVSSADTIRLSLSKSITLVGSATISSISGPAWPGRQVTMIPTGTVKFKPGNNIANGLTAPAYFPVLAIFNKGRWFLK